MLVESCWKGTKTAGNGAFDLIQHADAVVWYSASGVLDVTSRSEELPNAHGWDDQCLIVSEDSKSHMVKMT